MENGRQLATDPPPRSAAETVGPHLLGRLYEPDRRDWSLPRLLDIAEPPESILRQTLEQVIQETTYLTDWRSYLILSRWLKKQNKPPEPSGKKPAWELKIQLVGSTREPRRTHRPKASRRTSSRGRGAR